MKRWVIVLSTLWLFACGQGVKKNEPAPCGNGRLDPGELCDWGIADGQAGACPTACDAAADACTSVALVGDRLSCSAECVVNEPACGEGDGCCPLGCDSSGDADCTNTCNNGIVEGNETCDGNCPTTCDDRDACTIDSFSGSADTCSLVCQAEQISACTGGDGCCPPGCTSDSDSDCSAQCGNGTVDPGELCDGNCPASCDDGQACTTDRMVGGPSTCNAQCVNDPITTCVSGDSCCPAGCTSDNDTDCACVPRTCADVGYVCGTLDTGCNSTIDCGTCNVTQTCSQGACLNVPPDRGIGSACTSDAGCESGTCLTEAGYGYPGGYCVGVCDVFGLSCDGAPADGVCDAQVCVRSCTVNTDCRTGYECYAELGSSVKACHPVGLGARTIGQSCTSSMDCAGGQNVFCGGPADGYRNGYCQRYCSASATCPSGSHCAFSTSGVGLCLRDCTANSSCRGNGADGYMCYDTDMDGSSECFVAGTGAGGVGAPCEGPWNCGGGQWGRCGSESGGFPDGYCSIACGANQSTCPTGSHCGSVVTTSYCVDDCTTTSNCRAGYTCQDDGTIDACWP